MNATASSVRRLAALLLVAVSAACTSVPAPPAVSLTSAVAAPTAGAAVEGAGAAAPPAPAERTVTATATPRPLAVPRSAIEVARGDRAGRDIAFTFDCAANTGPTQEILDVLTQEDVVVTFFMVGIWARDHQDLTKQIARRHELANHSWAHPDYRDLTDAEIAADLDQNEAYHLALTGKSMKPLWRAPSGARDDRVLEAAARAGWPWHIFWTIGQDARGTVTGDSGDWRGIPGPEVYANTIRAAGLGGGVITVSHCDAPSTASTLRDTICAYRAMGLRIVTVSELLRAMPR